MANPYPVFDAIFCITLEEEPERHADVRKFAAHIGAPIELFPVKRHPRGGSVGCFDSHVRVSRVALERGCSNVLVFEDDVRVAPGYDPAIVAHVGRFMQEHAGAWNIIQLGHSIWQHNYDVLAPLRFMFAERTTQHLVRHGGMLTHAVCLSRHAMRCIVQHGEVALAQPAPPPPVDVFYLGVCPQQTYFSVIPIQFDQRFCLPTHSDRTDAMERLFRSHQCLAERWNLFHVASLLPFYKVHAAVTALLVLGVLLTGVLLATSARRGGALRATQRRTQRRSQQ